MASNFVIIIKSIFIQCGCDVLVSDLGGVDFVATGEDVLKLKFKMNESGRSTREIPFILNLDGKCF